MPPSESPSVSVCRRERGCLSGDSSRTIVWVRGEHDAATRPHLSVTFAQAAALDDADIVVDLSGVTFMDASTIGALVVARNQLQPASRSLFIRDPSLRARRVLDLCGLEPLIDAPPVPAQPPVATALGSWVEVPAGERNPVPVPPVVRDAAAVPIQQPRAPS